jgi:hypothetical protein
MCSSPRSMCHGRKVQAYLLVMMWLAVTPLVGYSQDSDPSESTLFNSDEVLHIRLSGNIRELINDRSDKMQYHKLTLSYRTNDGSLTYLPVKVKTRGHFRRTEASCTYPPLLFNFSKNKKAEGLFLNQDKLKLVTACTGDQYVLRECLVYQLYNLITQKSFKARLVKIAFDDTVRNTQSVELFSIFLEEENQMARRNHAQILDDKPLKPEQTRTEDFLIMAVFQYMIGNTDWSVQYFQNIKLITADRNLPSPVPYDFDHAGIVSAPYARPEEALHLNSVRDRRFRGYCMPVSSFKNTFAIFNQHKKDIYRVYTECPYLDESYVKTTIQYLDDFYNTINDPESSAAEFGYPCQKEGTGNVVIKGLKKK